MDTQATTLLDTMSATATNPINILLNNWDLDHLSNKFHEEGITLDILEDFIEEKHLLESLVPRIGDRLRLVQKAKDYFHAGEEPEYTVMYKSKRSSSKRSPRASLASEPATKPQTIIPGAMGPTLFRLILALSSLSNQIDANCDLELLFIEKRVSIEESVMESPIVFRGASLATAGSSHNPGGGGGEFMARFELLNTFKDMRAFGDRWSISTDSDDRIVNVTIMEEPTAECATGVTAPSEYIVFGYADGEKISAASLIKWSERTDQRVWMVLGWSKWGEWSPCSVSCSSGIQQRVRHCLKDTCPGHNVEQRHCNMFRCDKTINPLTLEDGHFFHPSKENWKSAPDRTSAWRLEPYTYLWVPSVLLLAGLNITQFPRQFSIFFTVRLFNDTSGTIFSLRSRTLQDTYLSIDFRKDDLKLAHAAQNGSDTVIIPVDLADNQWHQIAISIRDSNVIDCFVDCQWVMTDILRFTTLDLPGDSDLIIGYLFSGDLEQLSIAIDPTMVNQHCSTSRTPIIDPGMDVT